ncbi:MAG: N-acetylmuramoyl-L-alanine amidase [Rhizomicrobium sp.]
MIERPSPNHDARPRGVAVDILVLHYTGMRTAEEALARLCDPIARVSAHYTIDTDGQVYRHVDESRRAWHAGVSYWAGRHNVNGRSIGIELVNPGHEFGYVPFAEAQIAALVDLAHGILARHPIPARHVLGHSDVAPARKMDPGELFPWQRLAEIGVGMFPPPLAGEVTRRASAAVGGENALADGLEQFGYGIPPEADAPLAMTVTAFQRHFRPEKVDGVVDDETEARLTKLLGMIGETHP